MQLNKLKTYSIHIGLFVATVITTTLAGSDWIQIQKETWMESFIQGLSYSLPFLGILTIHEFGHFYAARWHKVLVTLPYYLPLYFPGISFIGTLGAFIRIKSPLRTRTIVFDVGVAGPIAGFIAALGVLFYGFTHLPPPEYVHQVHKEYAEFGRNFENHVYTYDFLRKQDSLVHIRYNVPFVAKESYVVLSTGTNLLFQFFEKYVASETSFVPNKYEMFHYPFLFAGFLALFFTALNLIPIGQLDGGHILYALIGAEKQKILAPILFSIFVYLGTLGFLKETYGLHPMDSFDDLLAFAPIYLLFLYFIFSRVFPTAINNVMLTVIVFAIQFFTLYFFPDTKAFEGWWLFAIIIGRFIGIYHPPALEDKPLNTGRKIIGWISFVIFILCFSPEPLSFEIITP